MLAMFINQSISNFHRCFSIIQRTRPEQQYFCAKSQGRPTRSTRQIRHTTLKRQHAGSPCTFIGNKVHTFLISVSGMRNVVIRLHIINSLIGQNRNRSECTKQNPIEISPQENGLSFKVLAQLFSNSIIHIYVINEYGSLLNAQISIIPNTRTFTKFSIFIVNSRFPLLVSSISKVHIIGKIVRH